MAIDIQISSIDRQFLEDCPIVFCRFIKVIDIHSAISANIFHRSDACYTKKWRLMTYKCYNRAMFGVSIHLEMCTSLKLCRFQMSKRCPTGISEIHFVDYDHFLGDSTACTATNSVALLWRITHMVAIL